MLSVQNVNLSIHNSNFFVKILFSRTDTVSAVSSNLGMVISFRERSQAGLPKKKIKSVPDQAKVHKLPERRHRNDGSDIKRYLKTRKA